MTNLRFYEGNDGWSDIRMNVFQLTGEAYSDLGYCNRGRLIQYDGRFDPPYPNTRVLWAGGSNDRVVGTVSITLDGGEEGLPIDDDFPDELATLRDEGMRFAYVWRLVVEKNSRRGDITRSLFREALQTLKDWDVSTYLCVVHPKHAGEKGLYYQWGLRRIAFRDSAVGLKKAPAVLMVAKALPTREEFEKSLDDFYSSLPNIIAQK